MKFNFEYAKLIEKEELKQAFMIMFYEIGDKLAETQQMLVDFHNGILNTIIIGYQNVYDELGKIDTNNLKFKKNLM